MTKIIETITKQFRFDNEFDQYNIDNPYYIVTIVIKELEYDNGKHYYDIEFKYNFISSEKIAKKDNDNLMKLMHPFYGCKHQSFQGEIIYKNEMIKNMIEHLMMDDDKLCVLTGLTTVQRYRKNIMLSLVNYFWD
jgi:hypothetical protein